MSKPKFENVITLGSAMQVVVTILAVTTFFITMKGDVDQLKRGQEVQSQKMEVLTGVQHDMKEALVRVETTVNERTSHKQ